MSRMLYLVKDINGQDFKIGIGIESRFDDLKRDYEIDWDSSIYFEGEESDIVDMERILHKTFKKYRLTKDGTGGTEWFGIECYENVLNHIETYKSEFEFDLTESKKISFQQKRKKIKKIDKRPPQVKINDELFLDYDMDKEDFELLFQFMEYGDRIEIDLMDSKIDESKFSNVVYNCFTYGNKIGFAHLFQHLETTIKDPKTMEVKYHILKCKPDTVCYEYENELREYYNSL